MAAANNPSVDLVSFVIKANGIPLPDAIRVLSVSIKKNINSVSSATITLLDGEADSANFDVSSSASFIPGTQVTIEGGYNPVNQLLFTGIITGQTIRLASGIGPVLNVACHDEAIKMSAGNKNNVFANQKDSDIINAIVAGYSGLTANVTATTALNPRQVQYHTPDWDFIVALAQRNGLIVLNTNNAIIATRPDADTKPVIVVQYGDNMLEFNGTLNALTQLDTVSAGAWDYKKQAMNSVTETSQYAGAGNLSAKRLSDVAGLVNFPLFTTTPLEPADLSDWAKAELIKADYSKIQGSVKFHGSALAGPGNYITLQGLGARFSGDHLVSGITHDFSGGNWTTEATIGLSATSPVNPPFVETAAPVHGLLNGIVMQTDDTDGQFRILVNIPVLDQGGEGIWARLANFYATSGAGAFFTPEIGDEVVLGFLNDDPRYPIILGSLYSNPKNMPYTDLSPNAQHTTKAIVSKSGIALMFNDEQKIFTVKTPGGNTIVLDDEKKQISMSDQNQNSVVMSADGISLTSIKDLTIAAEGQINIKATVGVAITAPGGDINLSGQNIKETADMQYTANGGQMAQVTSGMQLVLKSAMIMIN